MTRMLTNLLFVLALAGGAVAQNPLIDTEPNPVEVGEFLGIDYKSNRTESSVEKHTDTQIETDTHTERDTHTLRDIHLQREIHTHIE